MSVPADQFGNSSSSSFLNTDALGLGTSTNTSPVGMPGNPFPSTTPVSSNPTTGVTDIGSLTSPASSGFSSFAPSTGTAAPATSSTGTDIASLVSSLGSGVSSLLNSPLGSMAELGGLYAIISGQANATQTQNNALAQQISNIGQPSLTAGTDMLNSYTAGNLTAPFQAQADAAKAADAKTATSQEQQVAQMLANSGGQNMQSAQIGQTGQIEAQKNLADQTAVSNAFLAELSSSLNLTQTGGGYVQSGIMQEIQSNTALQQQLSSLMGDLAKAYAQQTSASGGGGAAGGGTTAGGALNTITGLLTKYGLNSATNAITGAGSSVLSGLPTAADALATSAAGAGVAGLAGAAPAAADLGAVSSIGSGIADAALGGGAAAGGAAAAGGIGAGVGAAAVPDLALATLPGEAGAAGAAGAGAAGTGAGIGALGAAGIAGGAALAAYAIYSIGNSANWFGNNSKSSVMQKQLAAPQATVSGNNVQVPQGSVAQWTGSGGSGRIIGTAQGGTTLAMQATYAHDPGDPVLYPPGGNAYTGQGGWEMKGFHTGAGGNLATATLTNQQTGQTINASDPAFQQTTGISQQQFAQMYQQLTSEYTQGQTG